MEPTRLKIGKEEDRLAVAAILIKNGYRVRQVKEKPQASKNYVSYLEVDNNNDGR